MKKITTDLSGSLVFGYNKEKYTEVEILNGILNNNDNMIRYIYRKYFPGIRSMVVAFHNVSIDAEDVFQEGLTRAVINVREHKFNGTSTFYTYLTSICRNVCLKEMQKSVKRSDFSNHIIENDNTESNNEDLIERINSLKNEMDKACKQIIDLRFGLQNSGGILIDKAGPVENMKFEEIAKQLNDRNW